MEESPVVSNDPIIETEPGAAAKNETPPPDPIPEKAKKGRPAGAKDRAPRKKKITIVEEPLAAPQEPSSSSVVETERPPPAAEPMVVVAPPSPRTALREASQHMINLRQMSDRMRKSHLQETYTKKLHSF